MLDCDSGARQLGLWEAFLHCQPSILEETCCLISTLEFILFCTLAGG